MLCANIHRYVLAEGLERAPMTVIQSAVFLAALMYLVALTIWSFRAVTQLLNFPKLPYDNSQQQGPLVSIIIPARNEEMDMPHCLSSMAELRYRSREIIVIDDRSTDRTPRILADTPGIRFDTVRETPSGWTGKCWACHRGYELANGNLLLFNMQILSTHPIALPLLLNI
jgi:chlorobactene glucosyltransferase